MFAPKAKKVSGRADPGFPLGHNLVHGARHRIGVDHALNCSPGSQVTRMTNWVRSAKIETIYTFFLY